MPLFKKKVKPGEHELTTEGADNILHINYEGIQKIPSIESDPLCMSLVIEKLAQSPQVSRIIFHQQKKYEYGQIQTQLLSELAHIYNHFIKQKKILTLAALEKFGPLEDAQIKLQFLQYIFLNLLKTDPIGAYVETQRLLREERITVKKIHAEPHAITSKPYTDILEELLHLLENTQLIQKVHEDLPGYKIGTREFYESLFRPLITPDFMFTRLQATPPLDGEEIDAYNLGPNTHVNIFNLKETIKQLYHITPPEFKISEDKYELLDLARKVLVEHQPKAEEFIDPERMRLTFMNIGKDLLTELSDHKGLELHYKELEEMAEILVRYTVGFGLIETLLQDPEIQDIFINSPAGSTPIFVVHGKYGECVTNIIPSVEDVESWASKLRLLSARPLDEANPILDTELFLPGIRARVAAITRPLNPTGISLSLRKHRENPWTLPLFIENNMLSPLAAGLLSFLIDGSRTLLVAGTRGSGKTSLLGSLLVEIMRRYRIISIEDTLEIPTESLRQLGYNILPMKVQSALMKGGSELSADEGIRSSLRLGDSALIVGEIRSMEALALYEAMRIGALANVVAGTIHGDSPYGVFDRVVNDLKVPRTSFKATDIIIVANPIKSPDGLHSSRRVVKITEVRKHWEDDPLREGGFIDLMIYNAETDQLEPTDALLNGESEVLKSIGGQIKEWTSSWESIWENIQLRAKIKQRIVDYAKELSRKEVLEAKHCVRLNDEFHRISDKIRRESGFLDPKRIFFLWEEEMKSYFKKEFGPLYSSQD